MHLFSSFFSSLFPLLLLIVTPPPSSAYPFSDVSLHVGLSRPFGPRRKYGGAAIADLDGDGWPDLLCGHHDDRSMQVYFNDRNGRFILSSFFFWRDIHALTPFRPTPWTPSLSFVSSNGGFAGKRPRHPQIFNVLRNRSIVDVTNQSTDIVSVRRRGRSAIFLSLRQYNKNNKNNNSSGKRIRAMPDMLLLNRVDGTGTNHRAFEIDTNKVLHQRTLDAPQFIGAKNNYGGVLDVDGDSSMEVFLLSGLHFRIFKLVADFTLREVTDSVLPRESSKFYFGVLGAVEFDFDNDGHFDVFLARSASGHHSWLRTRKTHLHDSLLRNIDGKRYVDVSDQAGILPWGIVKNNFNNHMPPPSSHGVTAADFDNDGHIDLFISRYENNPISYLLLLNNGDGKTFRRFMPALGFARQSGVKGDTVSAVDYDGDGRVDLIVSEGTWGGRPGEKRYNTKGSGFYRVVRNTWVTGNSWVLVWVRSGPGMRATSMHASVRVDLYDGSSRWRRVGSPGTVVSNSYVDRVHFGLGRVRARVKAVSVRWTDGSEEMKRNVGVNQTLVFGVV